MRSPQFSSKRKSETISEMSHSELYKNYNEAEQHSASKVYEQSIHDENKNSSNQTKDKQAIFSHYRDLVDNLASSEYNIGIVTQNIIFLEKQFVKKEQLYTIKQKQVEKLKKMNSQTTEAIQAQNHRTKKLKKSNKRILKELQEIQAQLNQTFQQRLKSQTHKNMLYEQYKELEEEYAQKMQELQSFFTSKVIESNPIQKSSQSLKSQPSQSMNTTFNDISPTQALQAIKRQNNEQLPQLLAQNQYQIESLERKLESHLQRRQLIKQHIQQITENIKSYEEEQYQHQITIQNLQTQKALLAKSQQKVQQKNQYLNRLFKQVEVLKDQLDQKCQEKYDLVNYLRQVEKEEKQMRKIRKIQVECSKEQQIYRQQRKSQQFTVLQSEQDQSYQQMPSKQSFKSPNLLKPSGSPNNTKNQNVSSPQTVLRFDTETRQKLSSIMQRYEMLKNKRKY